jgi:hypothetical protein
MDARLMSGSVFLDLNLHRYTLFRNRPVLAVHNTATQSIPNSTWTTITLPTVDIDSVGGYNTGTSTWTCPLYGTYRISAGVTWAANATPSRAVSLLVNGSTRYLTNNDTPTSTGAVTSTIVSQPLQIPAGWTVQLQADQNSGAALSTSGSPYSSFLHIIWDRVY